ncbi:glycine receptor subunit alphaZ1-like [Watersipora subatra]|uniref:glycine receptor subunit alphaZ1-like n=1 Tax=Watersipora subatra TaxID=2589382 RepID=UPI00355B2D73
MYLRQRWKDARLSNPNLTDSSGILITSRLDDIWRPDLFIKNDKSSQKSEVTTLNAFLRVDSEGQLIYSLRVSATVSCPMHLTKYPFDVQYCNMLLESYGHSTEELKFYWNERNGGQAVEINDQIELPEHVIGSPVLDDCTEVYNTTGSFSCISIQFEFTRNINYYVMSLFLPTILIVILSWVSFWIDKSSTPGRVSLALLTILTMQNQMSSTLAQLPKVSYIKLVDVWLTGCLAFVFAGFLEYALVNKLATKEKETKVNCISEVPNTWKCDYKLLKAPKRKAAAEKSTTAVNNFTPEMNASSKFSSEEDPNKSFKPKMSLSDQVDFYSKFAFPSAFLLFNLVLWLIYLLSEDVKPTG